MKKKKIPKTKRAIDPADQVLERVVHYRDHYVDYFKDVLGIKHVWRKPGDLDNHEGEPAIWSLQEDLLLAIPRAIKERKSIYVASGHSCGKDFVMGGIGLGFLQSNIPSLVVLNAPTGRQVNDIMWKETTGHWERKLVNLGGRAFVEPRIEIEKDWYLIGFSTKETGGSKEAGGAKFQGFKGKDNVAVLVTEAQAVEDTILDQIDAITTANNVLVIFAGNPTRSKGRFAQGLKDTKNNIVFHYSCLQNPNYIERRSVIPGLASYAWVEKMRAKWGEDDPRWISRVLGKLPEGTLDVLFPEKVIDQMRAKQGFLAQYSDNRGVSLDPAGEGFDENVIMAGAGGQVLDVYTKTKMTPTETAIKAVEMCKAINGYFIVVDCDGLGQRDYAELKKLPDDYLRGIKIIAFHGSAPSQVKIPMDDGSLKPVYGNMRAEAGFVAADRGSKGRAALNEKDIELREDLEADEFFEKKGVLWLIDKGDVKESLPGNRSPGRGDCFKMLQWAFNKEFKDETYKDQGSGLPEYARTDRDLEFETRNLPRYGQTS